MIKMIFKSPQPPFAKGGRRGLVISWLVGICFPFGACPVPYYNECQMNTHHIRKGILRISTLQVVH
jgi:hypothetical protein